MFSRTMTIPHWFSPITRVFIVAVAIFGLSEFARAQTIVVEIQGFVTRSDWDGINTGDVVEVKYTIPYPLVNSYGPQGGNQAKSFGYNTASMSLTMGALTFTDTSNPGLPYLAAYSPNENGLNYSTGGGGFNGQIFELRAALYSSTTDVVSPIDGLLIPGRSISDFDSASFRVSGTSAIVDSNVSNYSVTYVDIPEPSVYALSVGAGSAAFAIWRRRRKPTTDESVGR